MKRIPWWTIAAVAAVMLLMTGGLARFTGKGSGVVDLAAMAMATTADDCIREYAVPAASKWGSRNAVNICRRLHAPGVSAEMKDFANCALPQLAKAKNDVGAQAAFYSCRG
jgi:hypothetical protein